MRVLSGTVVAGASLFLLGLAVVIVARPVAAERFLSAFARSARAHYTEQVARLIVGAAMVTYAPSMWLPRAFTAFGWLLVVTALGLLVVPWRWHQRFATWAVPTALRRRHLLALGAAMLGAFVLYATLR